MVKTRLGFVSNSSSSSFVIAKKALKKGQLRKIFNHYHKGITMGLYTPYPNRDMDIWNTWAITVEGGMVKGSTDMDNFPMDEFLEAIGVDMNAVEWWHS